MSAVEDLGQRQVIPRLGLGAGPHRRAEAGRGGLEAVHRDDERVLPPRGVVGVGVCPAEEHLVLDGDPVEFAGAHADEGQGCTVRLVLLDDEAVVALCAPARAGCGRAAGTASRSAAPPRTRSAPRPRGARAGSGPPPGRPSSRSGDPRADSMSSYTMAPSRTVGPTVRNPCPASALRRSSRASGSITVDATSGRRVHSSALPRPRSVPYPGGVGESSRGVRWRREWLGVAVAADVWANVAGVSHRPNGIHSHGQLARLEVLMQARIYANRLVRRISTAPAPERPSRGYRDRSSRSICVSRGREFGSSSRYSTAKARPDNSSNRPNVGIGHSFRFHSVADSISGHFPSLRPRCPNLVTRTAAVEDSSVKSLVVGSALRLGPKK